MTKFCVPDQDDCDELAPEAPTLLEFQSAPHAPWPVQTLKPEMVQGSLHRSHSHGSRIRSRPPSTCGLHVCVPGQAELPEEAPQKTLPQCMAKLWQMALPPDDLCLGVSVSFGVSLKKVALGTCQCWIPWSSGRPLLTQVCPGLFLSAAVPSPMGMLPYEHLNHWPRQTIVLQDRTLRKRSFSIMCAEDQVDIINSAKYHKLDK